MSDTMFKDFLQPEGKVPCNRPKPHHKREIVIMAGETAQHSFEIPFDVENDTLDFDILYKLGLDLVITKNRQLCKVIYDKDRHFSIISCNLSPEETLLFGNTTLEAKVQIRFRMTDLSLAYTEVYKIKLLDSLDLQGEIPPVPPHIIAGIGYTED